MPKPSEDTRPGLIDLTDVPLAQLWSLGDDTALDHVLRRVTEPAQDQPAKSVSAFNSAI
jgi:FXSXX-COOH protein